MRQFNSIALRISRPGIAKDGVALDTTSAGIDVRALDWRNFLSRIQRAMILDLCCRSAIQFFPTHSPFLLSPEMDVKAEFSIFFIFVFSTVKRK